MMGRAWQLRMVLAVGVLVLVAACSTRIHRVDSSLYGYGARENLTVTELKPAVERAATRLGWVLSDVKTGSFKGARRWGGGKHSMVVEVVYRPKNFDIKYVDSKALSYGGTSIHHSYNDFVTKLEGEIKAIVAKL